MLMPAPAPQAEDPAPEPEPVPLPSESPPPVVDPPPPPAMAISTDSRCGAARQTRCPTGVCCSQHDWCGTSSLHCGDACQVGYGECWSSPPPPPEPPAPPPPEAALTPAAAPESEPQPAPAEPAAVAATQIALPALTLPGSAQPVPRAPATAPSHEPSPHDVLFLPISAPEVAPFEAPMLALQAPAPAPASVLSFTGLQEQIYLFDRVCLAGYPAVLLLHTCTMVGKALLAGGGLGPVLLLCAAIPTAHHAGGV